MNTDLLTQVFSRISEYDLDDNSQSFWLLGAIISDTKYQVFISK